MTLVLEIRESGAWREIGRCDRGQTGSLSNNTDTGRDVIHFACQYDEAVIERSIGGTDQELGALRLTTTIGMERLTTLAPGECFELLLRTDPMVARQARPVPLRFRYEGGQTGV